MAHTSLHKAFQSKDKVSKSLTVLKEVISVDSKHEHMLISGRQTLLIVSQARLTLVANRPRAGADPSGAAASGRLVGNEKISGCGRQAGGGRAGRPAQEVPHR